MPARPEDRLAAALRFGKGARLHHALRGFIHCGLIKSAHDCSEGGLAVALAESCISRQIARETPRLIGAQIDLVLAVAGAIRLDALLFGETQSRVVISVAPMDAVKVVERAKILGVSAVKLGTVGGGELSIKARRRANSSGRWRNCTISGGTPSRGRCNRRQQKCRRRTRCEWINGFGPCAIFKTRSLASDACHLAHVTIAGAPAKASARCQNQ